MIKQKQIDIFEQKAVIGPLTWQITHLDEDDMPTHYGQCYAPLTAKIKLNPENTGMRALDTLLHEVVHAMDMMALTNLKEHQVEKLGTMLAMFLRDNEWIHNYAKQQVKQEYGRKKINTSCQQININKK